MAHKFTGKKRSTFLNVLKETGNVSEAAREVGLSRRTAYNLRESDEEFAKAWDEAVDTGIDYLEEEARRRAYKGVAEPVFYQGMECGTVQKYSDTLMIFLLKANRPDKYKDRVANEHTGKDGGAIENKWTVEFLNASPDIKS